MRLFEQDHKSREKCFKIIFFAFVMLFSSAIAFAASGGDAAEQVSKWVKEDWYKVLNFTVLVIVLFLVAKKSVKEFFTSRIKGIEKELADLEQEKQDAEEKIVVLEARLKDLDEESKKIVETYVQQGEDAKKRILALIQSK